jgi:putative hydrolase of the HAD superfamily
MNCSDIEFDNAWNSILLALRIDAMDNIKALKKIGKVALLSNTNEIHLKKFYPECKELFEEMNYLFFSYQIGLSKPDLKIFQYVIDNTNFDINEIFFIDDSSSNIDSAENFGLQTIKIDNYNLNKHIEHLSK